MLKAYLRAQAPSLSAFVLIDSLVPRPPPFLPSVCVHNNFRQSSDSVYYCEHKREIKTGEAWDQGYS